MVAEADGRFYLLASQTLEDIKKAKLKGYEDAIEGLRGIRMLCSGGMLAGLSTQMVGEKYVVERILC